MKKIAENYNPEEFVLVGNVSRLANHKTLKLWDFVENISRRVDHKDPELLKFVEDISRLVDYKLVKDGIETPLQNPAEVNSEAVKRLTKKYRRDEIFRKTVDEEYNLVKDFYVENRLELRYS